MELSMKFEWPEKPASLAVQIDSCDYLCLREISEPTDNCLRMVIEEAGVVGEEVTMEIAGVTFTKLHPIKSTKGSRRFEMIWDTYVAYSVRNESYSSADKREIFEGERIRVYSKSNFLEFIKQATFATDAYPGPYQHVQVVCLDHVVDVAAVNPPGITLLPK